jgi:hypothetical protein
MRQLRPRAIRAAFALLALAPLLPAHAVGFPPACQTSQSTVKISDLQVEGSTVQAKGSWQVSGSAAGVMIEYRVDSDRLLSEDQAGTTGAWDLAYDIAFEGCGPHTLRVFAFPYVMQGTRQIHCLQKNVSTPKRFEVSCAPIVEIVGCEWECGEDSKPACQGTCSGSAKSGRLSYVPFWGVDDAGYTSDNTPAEGPWTQAVSCSPGQKISFKVRDKNGTGFWSNVATHDCGKP